MSADGGPELPQEAYAVALASLPSTGPARLRTMLAVESPAQAWERADCGRGGIRARGGQGMAAAQRPRHSGAPGRKAALSRAARRRPAGPRRALLPRRPGRARGLPHGGAGGHPRADALRHRRRRTVRRRSLGRGCQCRVRSRPGHRRCGARRCVRCRRATRGRGGGWSRPRVSAAARAVMGAGGVPGRDRLGVPGGCPDREVALPGPQPAAGRPERRRGRRGEPPPRRIAPHRGGRRGQGRTGRGGAGVHPQRDVRGHERAPRRRRISRVLVGRHPHCTDPPRGRGRRAPGGRADGCRRPPDRPRPRPWPPRGTGRSTTP